MRGEDTYITSTRSPENGSPPHARGRLLAVTHPDKQTGITPACAGKTWALCSGLGRVRGSPPHARGRQQH